MTQVHVTATLRIRWALRRRMCRIYRATDHHALQTWHFELTNTKWHLWQDFTLFRIGNSDLAERALFSAQLSMQGSLNHERNVRPSVRPSVCPSVKRVNCDKTRRNSCPRSYTTWKIIHPSLLTRRTVGWGDPIYLKFWVKLTLLERERRFPIDIRS